jgi:MoaA/NifB/PqqE/SkfB family radical SAM enzyme
MRRRDIKLGFACNNNCRFCAVGHKKCLGSKDTERIKSEIYKNSHEFEEIVLTGGEPTVRPDILELVAYAREVGYEYIQIQSNGRMFCYKKFCEGIIDAGLNEFALSLHGPTAEIHDFLTQSPGSFEQTVQGIKNLKELDQCVLCNSVATKSNYTHLPEIAHLLVNLGVFQFQMAFVHGMGNADENFDYIVPRKSLAAPYIKKALQVGIDAGVRVMSEDMPYCFMKGYEKYIGELFIPSSEVIDIDEIIPKFEDVRIEKGKCKGEKCKKCKYYRICEGTWKDYPERRGWSEFIPVEDE